MLNLKEKFRAKRFGYTRVVWAKRSNGVPFHQMFIRAVDADEFAKRVGTNGGQVVKIEEI